MISTIRNLQAAREFDPFFSCRTPYTARYPDFSPT